MTKITGSHGHTNWHRKMVRRYANISDVAPKHVIEASCLNQAPTQRGSNGNKSVAASEFVRGHADPQGNAGRRNFAKEKDDRYVD